MKIALVFLLCVSTCSGLFGPARTKWNDLRVTFLRFNVQPKTVEEAKSAGFQPVDPDASCGATNSYNGVAYAKPNDYSLILLFDVQGNIAGIQTAVSKEVKQQQNYPGESIRPPFVLDGLQNERYVLTAYFTEPSKICTEGNEKNPFEDQAATDNLWLQTGATAAETTKVSLKEEDVPDPWVKGNCFAQMGTHYWYNISTDMDCANFFPVFLLYDKKGDLIAFGWAMGADLESDNYEHPPKASFGAFMKDVPKCLFNYASLSTMHIYMTDNPGDITC